MSFRSAQENGRGGKAFAVGPMTPLVVRGSAPILSWSPQRFQPSSADTVHRLLDLYRHTDVRLASTIDESIKLAAMEHAGDTMQKPGSPRLSQVRGYFADAAGTSFATDVCPCADRMARRPNASC